MLAQAVLWGILERFFMADRLLIDATKSKLPEDGCFDTPKPNDTCQLDLVVKTSNGKEQNLKWKRQGNTFQLVGKLSPNFTPDQAKKLEQEVQLLGKFMSPTKQKQLSNFETRFVLYLRLAEYIVQSSNGDLPWGNEVGVELLKLLTNSPNWNANLNLLNGILSTEKDTVGYDAQQISNIKKILSLLLNLKAAEKGINTFVDPKNQEFVFKYDREYFPKNDGEIPLKRKAFELMVAKQPWNEDEKGKVLEYYKSIVEMENLYRYILTHVAQLFMGGAMLYDQDFQLAYHHYVTLSGRSYELGDTAIYAQHAKVKRQDPSSGQEMLFDLLDDPSKFCRGLTLLFAPLKEEGVATIPNLERCVEAVNILQVEGTPSVNQSLQYYWSTEDFNLKIAKVNTDQANAGMTTYPYETLKGDAGDPDRMKKIMRAYATLVADSVSVDKDTTHISAARMVEVANQTIKAAALGRKRHYRVAMRVFLDVLKGEFNGQQNFSLLIDGKFVDKKISIEHPEILTQYINQLSQEAAISEARTDVWLPLSESAVAVVGGGLLVHGLSTDNKYTQYSGAAAAGLGLGALGGLGFVKLFDINAENEWIPHLIGGVLGTLAGTLIMCQGFECMTGSNPGHELEPEDLTRMNHVSEFGP